MNQNHYTTQSQQEPYLRTGCFIKYVEAAGFIWEISNIFPLLFLGGQKGDRTGSRAFLFSKENLHVIGWSFLGSKSFLELWKITLLLWKLSYHWKNLILLFYQNVPIKRKQEGGKITWFPLSQCHLEAVYVLSSLNFCCCSVFHPKLGDRTRGVAFPWKPAPCQPLPSVTARGRSGGSGLQTAEMQQKSTYSLKIPIPGCLYPSLGIYTDLWLSVPIPGYL